MIRIRSDRILLQDRLFDGYLYLENGRIAEISEEERPAEEEYDFCGRYVFPGLIDIHTHGGGGNAFEGSVEEILRGCDFHLSHGTTSICPTVSAAPICRMAESVRRIELAMKDPRARGTIIGAHLEGPYLSRKQAGAQSADFITPPKEEDYLPILQSHGSVIARWSYAPENDFDGAFASALKKHGVVASAGHTDAIYDDMISAMERGCSLVTHLYSCTSTVTRDHGFRRLGVIETAFLRDDLFVEIICDGRHLPPELIQMIYKIKGADRIALITDSLSLTGTDLVRGRMEQTEFVIEDGVCKLLDRSAFAGSIATADRLLRVAVKDAEIPLFDAVRMLTETPARIMGLSQKGRIGCGLDADLTVFDGELQLQHVFAMGRSIPIA